MPIRPEDLVTGGALQGAVAASLIRTRNAAAELVEGAQVGIYRIVREIGRGGMAIVYEAARADGEYEQRVALKWMLQAQPDESSETLFRRERQALADLRHPHIARLLDGGRGADGRPWFAMELIDGEPLDRHAVQHALPQALRLQLFLQVCAAVAFAHARGVIHRDIKPSNVLVDSDGSARLLDFGIAQLLGQDDDLALRAYTPGFASPEQVRGETLTVASDVYQLGRLLASILSADSIEQATVAATNPSVDAADARIAALPRDLPVDVLAVIGRACEPDPLQRYATADALADDVRAILQRRPVRARNASFGYAATRFVQRHPLGTGAAILALVIVIVGSAMFTWRLRVERDAAGYQARVATSVLDFLQDDLLASVDPAAARGSEPTVRQALDLASAAAERRFAQTPVELAAVRATLARLYYRLGRYTDAEREARQALAASQGAQVPPAQPLRIKAQLADALVSLERLDEAEPLLVEVVAGWTQLLGHDSREAIDARFSQGYILDARGDYAGAEQAFAQAATDAGRALPPNDELALSIASRHADVLQQLGRYDQALAKLQSAHASSVASRGMDHPKTLELAHNVGSLQRDLGRPDEALAWLEPTLQHSRRVLGDEHPETLSTANVLAGAYWDAGRHAPAEALFDEVLASRLRVLGEENTLTRVTMGNLGQFHLDRQQPDLAAPLIERALALDLRIQGESHPSTLASMNAAAKLYRAQGRFDDAIAMHERVIAGVTASLGVDAWQGGMARAAFAGTLDAAGRLDAADAQYAQAHAVLRKALGDDDPRTARVVAARAALAAKRE